jgi:hypothetical protein
MTFEEVLLRVWRQSLIDGSKFVSVDDDEFPVRTTAKQKLKQIDFQ